jgi:hypothetical protein
MARYRQPLGLVVGMDEILTSGSAQCLEQNFPDPFSNSRVGVKKIDYSPAMRLTQPSK